MPKSIQKVTAFVTRETPDGPQLLLFRHPHAGIQIPAGTVESGETPEKAVLREVREETGLTQVRIVEKLGLQDEKLPDDVCVTIPPATIYARPDRRSFDWITIRSAVQVNVDRKKGGFTQITYIENDCQPDPQYVSMQITGWVLDVSLADTRQRHFYHLEFTGQSDAQWSVFTDHHTFAPFWAPLDNLPEIIPPQDDWLRYLNKMLQ